MPFVGEDNDSVNKVLYLVVPLSSEPRPGNAMRAPRPGFYILYGTVHYYLYCIGSGWDGNKYHNISS